MHRLMVTALGGLLGTLIACVPIILIVLIRGGGDAQGGLGAVFAFAAFGSLGMIVGLIIGFINGAKHP